MTIEPDPSPIHTGPPAGAPWVIDLDDDRALDATVAGGKATALARAHRSGAPTLPARVITTAVSEHHDAGGAVADIAAIADVVGTMVGADRPLAVRSSSVAEDQASSSQAGQFETVLDVVGTEALYEAVEVVLRSRARADAADQPIAVLVQPMVEPEVAGVAFGVDPVSGRTDRRAVVAVRGRPDALVGGEVDGSRWLLDTRGHVLEADLHDGVRVATARLRELVALGDRLEEVFGAPQDVEWAVVGEKLVLFQSRPVTTLIRGVPTGPVYGPGPVAETFPEPLTQLEIDLWVPPLRGGVRDALRLSGAVSAKELETRELVTVVDGRVALDLEVTGAFGDPDGPRRRPSMAARVRRLRSAWRIGRLRLALPYLADELAEQVDEDLAEVPPLAELSTRQLVALIGRARKGLRSLHAHEILMGMVTEGSASTFTGASVALRVLAESRAEGYTDEQILARSPLVLALVPPQIGAPIVLPSTSTAGELDYDAPEAASDAVQRESLRLRIRWMQELVGQAAFEVGGRLVDRGMLVSPDHVRHLRFEEMADIVSRRAVAATEVLAAAASLSGGGAPGLPARFRVSDRGLPIAIHDRRRTTGGTGAGGGVGRGRVTHDAHDPAPGSVLVVPSLTPQLGPVLHRLEGIVSETGSVLSHLAILARERGVATVVSYPDATRLAEGTVVTVDGDTGDVSLSHEGPTDGPEPVDHPGEQS